MNNDRVKELLSFVKEQGKKGLDAAKDWIAEREKDQKRLDYLDHDATRIGKVADKVSSKVSAREAIDELMADAVETG